MPRPIKFRQAIKASGQLPFRWHYWGYLEGNEFPTDFTMPLGKTEWDDRPSYQYTERHDLNGVEIYEGDRVDLIPDGYAPCIFEIKWGGVGFILESLDKIPEGYARLTCTRGLVPELAHTWKVIGNISEQGAEGA